MGKCKNNLESINIKTRLPYAPVKTLSLPILVACLQAKTMPRIQSMGVLFSKSVGSEHPASMASNINSNTSQNMTAPFSDPASTTSSIISSKHKHRTYHWVPFQRLLSDPIVLI